MVGGGAVGNDLIFFHTVADRNHRLLVDAGALVGAHEFDQVIAFQLVAFAEDVDAVCADIGDHAGLFGQNADAGVGGRLVFHTGADHRGITGEQGHGLPLHVGAHQGAVGVVIFQEGDQRGCDRNNHLGRHVHIIDA